MGDFVKCLAEIITISHMNILESTFTKKNVLKQYSFIEWALTECLLRGSTLFKMVEI